MHLVFDIFQGIGVAAAVGIRPFLPGLVAGALAAADVELSFDHTHFHFLQRPLFLFIMVVAIVILGFCERRLAGKGDSRVLAGVLAVCALAIGALLCGGAVARSHHSEWIGVGAGIVCASVGTAATQPLLARVRGRLDAEAGPILPLLADTAAALAAALSIVAPPLGVILVAALVWLLVAGRGRTEQKYAGLRILR
jgi:cell division protein FtsW (lipid II flippase)